MRTVLPRDLALWHASLLPGEARPALMLPWHISFSGEVSLLPLECATIKVQHPLTAQDASLALKDSKHLAHEQIALTNQVVQMLGNKAIDEQGWSLLDEDASNGHNMVARLMVTTNHLVGEFMHTQHPEIAFPYRVFEGSQEHIANDVLREAMAEHWSQVWERASQDPAHLMRKLQFMDLVAGKSSFKRSVSALLDRACYSLLPLGHKAVQDGDTPLLYAHVTSPLRRFMDFVAGYQIIAAHYGRPPIEREVMQSYANMASWTGRLQKSRALELGLLANFENITEKIGRTYDAKLLSTNKRQAVFQVCDFGRITVKLSAKQHVGNSTHKVIQDRTGNVLYSVGDIVSLRLSSWDFIANRPVFNLY